MMIERNTPERPQATPVCIVINGPSAVGKSTLVLALQKASRRPLLRFGVDELYQMVPPAWAGGTEDGVRKPSGFSYVEHGVSAQGHRLRSLRNGYDAVQMLRAMNGAIEGMLRTGCSVLVDGQAFEPSVNEDLHARLERLSEAGMVRTATIELAADAMAIDDRNARHRHPSYIGVHQSTMARQNSHVDLALETSTLSAEDVYREVCHFLREAFDDNLLLPPQLG